MHLRLHKGRSWLAGFAVVAIAVGACAPSSPAPSAGTSAAPPPASEGTAPSAEPGKTTVLGGIKRMLDDATRPAGREAGKEDGAA